MTTAAIAVIFAASLAAPPTQSRGTTGPPPLEAVCAVELPATRLTVTDFPTGPRAAQPTKERAGVILDYSTQPDLVASVRDLVRRYTATQNGGTPIAEQVGHATLAPGLRGAPPGTPVLVPVAPCGGRSPTARAAGSPLPAGRPSEPRTRFVSKPR